MDRLEISVQHQVGPTHSPT